MDFRLELILIPVTDVDRAKDFYSRQAGFRLDVDHSTGDDFRVVQLTPPGSACSVGFGVGITSSEPGSAVGMHLVVQDIERAHRELSDRAIAVSAIRHMTPTGWQEGVHPGHEDYASFADFADPDGNVWVLQEVGHGSRAD